MLKNMKIRPRLLLSYALIIVLAMAAAVTALVMLRNAGNELNRFYDNNFTVTVNAWTARRSIYAATTDFLQGIQETDRASTQAFMDEALAELDTMEAAFPVIKEKFPQAADQVAEIDSILASVAGAQKEMIDYSLIFENEKAYEIMKNDLIPQLTKVRELLKEISADADSSAKAMVESARQSEVISIITVAAIAALSVLLALVLGIYISNGVRKPVAEIQSAAKSLAEGRLGEAIVAYESRDELGGLAESMRDTVEALTAIITDLAYLMNAMADGNFNIKSGNTEGYVGDFEPILTAIRTMNNSLSDTLSQINEAADQVAGGSDQVAGGAQALSQGATEQASSVQELAATIAEISNQVKDSAGNAQFADEQAAGIGREAEESNRRMQDMLTAMGDISSSSSEIGKIIKTIEDIAFQTNILALNAAVEAARAGTAGKGFAVVADEVRNLANKSQEASKNTAALIEGSLKAVERGTQIANETAQSLSVVVEGIGNANTVIRKISEASRGQADAITQVSQGVEQISAVVQTNSATAEESAAASEELSGQAQMLKTLVSKFRLRDQDGAGAPPAAQVQASYGGTGYEDEAPSFSGAGKY